MIHKSTYGGKQGPLPIDLLLGLQATRRLGVLRRTIEDDVASGVLNEDVGQEYLELLKDVPDSVRTPLFAQ